MGVFLCFILSGFSVSIHCVLQAAGSSSGAAVSPARQNPPGRSRRQLEPSAPLSRSPRRTTFPRRRRAAGRCDWPGAGRLSVAVRQVPPAGAEHGAGCRGSAAAAAPAGRGLSPPAAAAPAPPLRTARGRTEKEGGRDVRFFRRRARPVVPCRAAFLSGVPVSPSARCPPPGPASPALRRPLSLPSPERGAGGAGGSGQPLPLPCSGGDGRRRQRRLQGSGSAGAQRRDRGPRRAVPARARAVRGRGP